MFQIFYNLQALYYFWKKKKKTWRNLSHIIIMRIFNNLLKPILYKLTIAYNIFVWWKLSHWQYNCLGLVQNELHQRFNCEKPFIVLLPPYLCIITVYFLREYVCIFWLVRCTYDVQVAHKNKLKFKSAELSVLLFKTVGPSAVWRSLYNSNI